MGLIDRALGAIGWERKSLGASYPDIRGGFEVFKGLNFGGGMTQSRMLQTYEKSLYVYVCVSKIAQKTASIDLELFRIKNKAGDTTQIYVHPALDLLYRPNPEQSKGEFIERWMINKKLTGEAFILKVRNGSGEVVELWNLRPDLMRVVKTNDGQVKGYEFTAAGRTTLFEPEDVIHDMYPSPLDDWGGMSPLRSAETRVDTEEFASKYQRNFFLNNARPDFILSSDRKVSNDQKEEIRESWEKRHKGSDKGGRGAILEGGLVRIGNLQLHPQDLATHIRIKGESGMGKSTLLYGMILELIRLKAGFALIDPHGEIYQQVFDHLAYTQYRLGQISLIDTTTREITATVNPFTSSGEEDVIETKAQVLTDMTMQVWGRDTDAVRAERMILAGYTVLLERELPLSALQGLFHPGVVDPETVRDASARESWYEFRSVSPRDVPAFLSAVRTRLQPLAHSRLLALTASEQAIDFNDLVNGKILLCNLVVPC
jgi:hypothetical protein